MKTILVTGAAGFIGWKVSTLLLEEGYRVVGVDNLNDYYDVKVKLWRLDTLKSHENFKFYPIDIENKQALEVIFQDNPIDAIINEAARAGVRYSLENPFVYLSTNTLGVLNLLELAKDFGKEVCPSFYIFFVCWSKDAFCGRTSGKYPNISLRCF